jgi:hypothetical protein
MSKGASNSTVGRTKPPGKSGANFAWWVKITNSWTVVREVLPDPRDPVVVTRSIQSVPPVVKPPREEDSAKGATPLHSLPSRRMTFPSRDLVIRSRTETNDGSTQRFSSR